MRVAAIMAVVAMLAACEQPKHITERINFHDGTSVLVDAQQRVVSNVAVHRSPITGELERQRIVCAEPSPDTALAVASTFAANLGLRGPISGPKTGISGEGGIQMTSFQDLLQLGFRSDSIQLLRDVLYRACEGYMNGALDEISYALIVSRMDALMTTLALGEMASGGRTMSLGSAGGDDPLVKASVDKLVAGLQDNVKSAEAAKKAAEAAEDADKAAAADKELMLAKAQLDNAQTVAASFKPIGRVARAGNSVAVRDANIARIIAGMHANYLNHIFTDFGPLGMACVTQLREDQRFQSVKNADGSVTHQPRNVGEKLSKFCNTFMNKVSDDVDKILKSRHGVIRNPVSLQSVSVKN